MRPEARLAMLEFSFFLLLSTIITFSLVGWDQMALLFSAIIAIAGRIALDYYYECAGECSCLAWKISMLPIITLIASALFLINFRRHPFLITALFTLFFILVIWKIAMLRNWIYRCQRPVH